MIQFQFLDHAYALGSYSPYHANLETLNLSTWRWEIRATYPYSSTIGYHANLIHNNRFVVFGGDDGSLVRTIAAYDYSSNSWQKLGNLINRRSHHDVIATQGAFLVVGDGYAFRKSEKCTLNGNTMTCIEQDPVIRSVEYYFSFQLFYHCYSTDVYYFPDAFQCRLELLHMKT